MAIQQLVHVQVQESGASALFIWLIIRLNPSYSACFFSRNSIFLSQKISQQFSRLIIPAERLHCRIGIGRRVEVEEGKRRKEASGLED
jgi:hypothetical protein